MLKTSRGPVVFALFMIILVSAFAGKPAPGPPANVYLAQTCIDTVDNDADSTGGQFPIELIDLGDNECLWMPYNFGNGEYDGQGLNNPPQPDVAAYISQFTSQYAYYPSQWDGIKALYDQYGMGVQDACNDTRVQPILTEYRDTYSVSDLKSGVSTHQSECSVSY